MNDQFRRYYEDELAYFAKMGAEFAEQYPRIASRLGITGDEIADPYVERLREGVAFLSARIKLKLDAEFPRFTQALLHVVYPHYLTPMPSMVVARFAPALDDTSLADGSKRIERGSAMRVALSGGDTTCEFRTADDVTLWPIEVTSASYFKFAPDDLPLSSLAYGPQIKAGVRIRLRSTAGTTFDQLALDTLRFFIAGDDAVANSMFELCVASPLSPFIVVSGGAQGHTRLIPGGQVTRTGLDSMGALLPNDPRTFQGHRHLQEYFAFPQRCRFVEVSGIAKALSQAATNEIDLIIPSTRSIETLERSVNASHFQLYCTPAINLFPRQADRINIGRGAHEFHVVVDRMHPLDYEVFQVTTVRGHGSGSSGDREFKPFYQTSGVHDFGARAAYFTARREPRLPSASEQERGGRATYYAGGEVYLSLVDGNDAPYGGDIRQLSVGVLCTNRDLVPPKPRFGGGRTDFELDQEAPVTSVRVVAGPSRPREPLADGSLCWRAISHLSLNYLSLSDSSPQEGAAALRELLQLYAGPTSPGIARQIEAVRSVTVTPVHRRALTAGPIAFCRGLQITVTIDEAPFEGGTAILLGSVLDSFFAGHASINSFTETIIRSESRGDICRWNARLGLRQTL